MKKILLHACCAPCATVPIERLRSDYEITLFFSNSNIYPKQEYLKRLKNIRHLAQKFNISLVEDDYDHESWIIATKGRENDPEGGKRCQVCVRFRLARVLAWAEAHNFYGFTTTLTVSPHKSFPMIQEIGRELSEGTNIQFLPFNFKKKDGFKQSVELAKKFDLYRQHYCGCEYSIRENKVHHSKK